MQQTRHTAHRSYLFPLLLAVAVPPMTWVAKPAPAVAETSVTIERAAETADFGFNQIPAPAISDTGSRAKWRTLRGAPSRNGASIDALFDGKIPSAEDSPSENFFFENGTVRGTVLVDLGAVLDISQVAAYSWHPGERAAQVYSLYGLEAIPESASSSGDQLAWDRFPEDRSPESVGWQLIAKVDTNAGAAASDSNTALGSNAALGSNGGQHASLISHSTGSLGKFQYLLFDFQPSDPRHPFGQTFFSEIDIVSTAEHTAERAIERVKTLERQAFTFQTEDGKYEFTVDTTAAPNLKSWSEKELKPVVLAWYPKIVDMLPSDGFTAPSSVRLRFMPNAKMNGIPAYAQNNRITMNAEWYGRELKREALGATVHELVHVVQQYGSGRDRSQRRSAPTPGWITEGVPDYIRWFLYEPQTQGALLSPQALAAAKHDASYRTSANFIDYVVRTHDGDGRLIEKLNAAARQGRYSVSIWKELTGLTVQELEKEWRQGK